MGEVYFSVLSEDGKRISTTKRYWELIVNWKHPVMKGREEIVKQALINPDQIRVSKSDERVRLYYKKVDEGFVCAVVKVKNGEGFIITTYITNVVKEGKMIWSRK